MPSRRSVPERSTPSASPRARRSTRSVGRHVQIAAFAPGPWTMRSACVVRWRVSVHGGAACERRRRRCTASVPTSPRAVCLTARFRRALSRRLPSLRATGQQFLEPQDARVVGSGGASFPPASSPLSPQRTLPGNEQETTRATRTEVRLVLARRADRGDPPHHENRAFFVDASGRRRQCEPDGAGADTANFRACDGQPSDRDIGRSGRHR